MLGKRLVPRLDPTVQSQAVPRSFLKLCSRLCNIDVSTREGTPLAPSSVDPTLTHRTADMSVYDKLKELNITLPPVATPAAAYVPFVQTG